MSEPGFWDRADAARQTVEEVKTLKRWVQPFLDLRRGVGSRVELVELLQHESDDGIERELADEASPLRAATCEQLSCAPCCRALRTSSMRC